MATSLKRSAAHLLGRQDRKCAVREPHAPLRCCVDASAARRPTHPLPASTIGEGCGGDEQMARGGDSRCERGGSRHPDAAQARARGHMHTRTTTRSVMHQSTGTAVGTHAGKRRAKPAEKSAVFQAHQLTRGLRSTIAIATAIAAPTAVAIPAAATTTRIRWPQSRHRPHAMACAAAGALSGGSDFCCPSTSARRC